VLTATDPDNNVTTLTYDSSGDIATIKNTLNQTTSYTSYDANGRLLSMTDPNGLTTTFTYDKRGRPLTRTVGTEETTFAYDSVGNLAKQTFPDSSYLTYTYDAAHRLTGLSDVAGDTITNVYDAASNLTQVQVHDPSNNLKRVHSYAYDSANRLSSETGAYSGETTSYTHDYQGNVLSVTDPLSHVTSFTYDALKRRATMTDALSHTTTYTYNAEDYLTSVSDPRGLMTSYGYDGLGDQTSITAQWENARARCNERHARRRVRLHHRARNPARLLVALRPFR
jgi:YD repeat-containing protein